MTVGTIVETITEFRWHLFILAWTFFVFLFVFPLAVLSVSPPHGVENPYICVSQPCHLSVVKKALESKHIHPPISDKDADKKCYQCHIDSRSASYRTLTSAHIEYDGQYTLQHRIRLTGLSPLTTYYYRVRSFDKDGNRAVMPGDGLYYFTTIGTRMIQKRGARREGVSRSSDLTPPRITDVRVEEIERGIFLKVTITWKTDEPSDSQIEYGIDSSSEEITPVDSGLVKEHRVTIFGLFPGKRYRFRVRSTDATGNTGFSGDHVFSTPPKKSNRGREPYFYRFFSGLSRAIGLSWALQSSPFSILNMRVAHLDDHSATIRWETDRPADSLIEYDTRKDSLSSGRFIHLPFKDKRETAIEGCYECHSAILNGPSHPVGVYPKGKMKVSGDLPRIEGGMITCVTCHFPHSSLEKYLVRKNWKREICVSCHDPNDL